VGTSILRGARVVCDGGPTELGTFTPETVASLAARVAPPPPPPPPVAVDSSVYVRLDTLEAQVARLQVAGSDGATPPPPSTGLPLDMQGAPPETDSVVVVANPPAGSIDAALTLAVFDADAPDPNFVPPVPAEGELWINGAGPVALFDPIPVGGNGRVTQWTAQVPAVWWVQGDNVLRFVHTSGGGYRIEAIAVTFSASAPPPPPPPAPPPLPPPPVGGMNTFFAAPTGTPTGDGSAGNPWDLSTAIETAGIVAPGDTILLLDGTYVGSFQTQVAGTQGSPVVIRNAPGHRPKVMPDPAVNRAAVVLASPYVYWWGVEVEGNPASCNIPGVNMAAPGVKVINSVIHDVSGIGVGAWSQAPEGQAYGNIIYNAGSASCKLPPESPYGHGIYAQELPGGAGKRIEENIVYHSFKAGLHSYTEDGRIDDMHVMGNLFAMSGAPGFGPTDGVGMIMGGGVTLNRAIVRENMLWEGGDGLWLGFNLPAVDAVVEDNYFFAGSLPTLLLNGSVGLTLEGNTLGQMRPTAAGTIQQTGTISGTKSWGDVTPNTFYGDVTEREFQFQGLGLTVPTMTFAQLQATTPFAQNDIHAGPRPTADRVFVRPNAFEAGRAHVIAYNWDGDGSVVVDLASVLSVGDPYEIHHVFDLRGSAVLSGTYDGSPVTVPVTAIAAPTPTCLTVNDCGGPTPAGRQPDPWAPDFAAFLVTTP